MGEQLNGLMAAVFTPMDDDGRLKLDVAGDYVDLLAGRGVSGILPGGTTGQFTCLSVAERMEVAEAFAAAAKGKLKVVIHVGHESLDIACELAAHAASLGADAVAGAPPCYFKPPNLDALVDWYERLAAAAPQTPLYYYHIPVMTGVELSVAELLTKALPRVPTLAGVKYTHKELDEYADCVDQFADRLQLLSGRD